MQSTMCIPLWPARGANTAHLVMCPFAGGSSSAFRHWRDAQMANCALSLVIWPGRDRLRHLAPVRSITQLAELLANELEEAQATIERLTEERDSAERWADALREDVDRLVAALEGAGQQVGLTQCGAVVAMPANGAAQQAAAEGGAA